jgi:hypothetical protein
LKYLPNIVLLIFYLLVDSHFPCFSCQFITESVMMAEGFYQRVSMRICGVDLTSNDAVICLLEQDKGDFNLPDCRVRKLTLKKDHTGQDLRQFQFEFTKLMSDYKVDRVVIRERMPKGKFAGGAISFKLESAIQLIADLDVVILTPTQIKTALSENPLPVAFSETGLKVFQEVAFKAAYAAYQLD